MRLIDADKIINDLEAMRTQFDAIALDGLIRGIAEQPTIDAEPVRHATLIEGDWDEVYCSWGTCSMCGADNLGDARYCSECGAKMDLEGEGWQN